MTDKQIIIDGVDVSGCEFFDECEVKLDWSNCLAHCSPYPEGACYDDCSEYPNCYYKQLKAKEQECERLKETFDGLFKVQYKLADNNKKLRQTLTEIKPILEFYANSTIGEEQEDGTFRIELSYKYGSSNMYGAPCYYKYNPKPAKQALQKISECEVK
jgi:hypothetical protein